MTGADVYFIICDGLTGGTSDSLDGQPTIRVTPEFSQVRFVVADGVTTLWQLNYGTDSENPSGGVVRPDDYNAITNAKVWRKVLSKVGDVPTYQATKIVTNDQILHLVATEVEVIASLGAGKIICLLQAMFVLDATAGAYGNVGDPAFYLKVTGVNAPVSTHAAVFADDDSDISVGRVYPYAILDSGSSFYTPGLYKAQMSGVGISVKSSNGGEYNLGNAANTLTISTAYMAIDAATGLFV